MKKTRSALILGLLLILASCSTTRHVEPGSYLLSKVSIRVDSLPPAELEQLGDLTTFLPQQPNTKLLGLFDWTLYVYSLSNPKSNSFVSRQLRKWGDPPVLYNAEEAEFGRANLTAAMYNLGYLKAKTELQVDTTRPKRARLTYVITPGSRLKVGHFEEALSDTTLRPLLYPQDTLREKRLFRGERYRSYLHSGAILSPRAMQLEQERISQIFRNRGYYTFTADSVRFELDTLVASDVWVRSVISAPDEVYRIGRVQMKQRPHREGSLPSYEAERAGISFGLDPDHYIRPSELARRIWIRPGQLYSSQHTSSTYAALSETG